MLDQGEVHVAKVTEAVDQIATANPHYANPAAAFDLGNLAVRSRGPARSSTCCAGASDPRREDYLGRTRGVTSHRAPWEASGPSTLSLS